MIDYFKLGLVGINYEDFMEATNGDINFKGKHNLNSGEAYDFPIQGFLNNLKIIIKGHNYIEISGSLHKYYESIRMGKCENWTQYSISKLAWTIARLSQSLGRNIKKFEIRSLEFGVNLIVDFDPKKIIERCIVNYNGGMKNETNTYGDTGYFCEFKRIQYYIKIYDKGKQYNRPDNILRFEYKTRKMELINKMGIRTLGDLLVPQKLNCLKNILLKKFDGLLIVDRYSINNEIPDRDRDFIEKGLDPFYWEDLKPKKEDYKAGSRDNFYNKKKYKYQDQLKKYRRLIDTHGLNKYSKVIRKCIIETWDQCADNHNISFHEMTLMNTNELQKISPRNDRSFCDTHPEINLRNDLLYKRSIRGRYLTRGKNIHKRICPITGIDISHQDLNTKYLTKASIRDLYNLNEKLYNELVRKFGKKGKVATTNEMIDCIVNTIQNRESKIRWNLKKRIKKINSGWTLFDNKQFIHLTSYQQYLLGDVSL